MGLGCCIFCIWLSADVDGLKFSLDFLEKKEKRMILKIARHVPASYIITATAIVIKRYIIKVRLRLPACYPCIKSVKVKLQKIHLLY